MVHCASGGPDSALGAERRYALGLLYLQVKNIPGAANEFQRIGNTGFVSEYFNFMIDTDALLLKKQNPSGKKAATL